MRSERGSLLRSNTTGSVLQFLYIYLALACLVGRADAASLGSRDMGTMTCSLFLRFAGTNAPAYPLFQALAEGFIAGRANGGKSSHPPLDVAATMSAVTRQCGDRLNDDFTSVLASVVDGELAKR